jgi:RNA-directed DNA polymerase
MTTAKSFEIPKRLVWEAYKRVKANRGAAGVDEQSLKEFEESLGDHLYRIWNRMSSGSYFPPPVKAVAIPKKSGGERTLGIPTVSDRIAQATVKLVLEPQVEPYFHDDSYGYRPGKSAHQAIAVTRKRCWRYDWVLEFDIKGLFDNIDHGLLMKAVRCHTNCRWVLLYIERWLTAPMQKKDGTIISRDRGTPQGGVISPLLANLFLHYAFDRWMATNFPKLPFCRYADDALIHCRSHKQAIYLRRELESRLRECGLELHPVKTKVVYCKDIHRKQEYGTIQFDFLGYTFRPRRSKGPQWPFVCQFFASNQSLGGKVHPTDDASLAVTVEERQDNRGSGPHVPSGDTRMDQLLLQVLSVCLSTHCQSSGSIFSAVGYAEVQKVPRPSTPSAALARADC